MIESTAKNILSRTVGRREFGKYVNECMLGWDGDKLVVGTYDGYNSIDYWNDKTGVQKFTEDAAAFCNDLNSKLHIKDYHFNIVETGILEGQIYISRDQDYIDQVVDSDNKLDDHNYIGEGAYMAYLTNKAVLQNKTKRMVKEALILTNDSIPVNEAVEQLISIQESSVGDAWDKFKAFFDKIWKKFMEFLNRALSQDKTYLEKYKDTILNKEFKLENVKMSGDYNKGVENISKYQVYQINSGDVSRMTKDSTGSYATFAQTLLMPAFKGSVGKQDFNAFCKSYFKGGEQEITYTGSNPSLSEMYNFCFTFNQISDSIQKDRIAMENAGRVFISAVESQDQVKPGPAVGGSEDPVVKAQAEVDTAQKEVNRLDGELKQRPEDATLKGQLENAKKTLETKKEALVQAREVKDKHQLTKPQANTESYIMAELGEIVIEGQTNTNSVVNVKNYGGQGGSDATAIRVKAGQGGENLAGQQGKTKDETLAKCNAYTSTATSIFTSMLTAAEMIEKGYMSIIKAHVQSYLGKEDTTNNTVTQATSAKGNVATVWDNKQQIENMLKEVDELIQAKNNGKKTVTRINANNQSFEKDVDERTNEILQMATNQTGQTNGVVNKSYDNLDALKADLQSRLDEINQQEKQNQQQTAPAQGAATT